MATCLPLGGFTTAIVYDKSEHYYAIGNTPPVNLIPEDIQNPEILCLAAGDPRSCLFSISRSSKAWLAGKASFVINDQNPAIIARNVLLLAFALRPEELECSPLDLWDVWHSLFITPSQSDCICNALRALLKNDSLLVSLPFSFGGDTLQTCRGIWKMWLEMNITPAEVEAMQDEYLNPRWADFDLSGETCKHFVRQGYIGGGFLFGANKHDTTPPVRLRGLHKYQDELVELANPKNVENLGLQLNHTVTQCAVNATLFMHQNRYNLHYGTAYYASYPLWNYNPGNETLKEYCQGQLAQWTKDLRRLSKKVCFEFIHGDCLSICLNNRDWCGKFDVVDTSNVCDYVGLPGLLLACRPLIASTGVLLTNSMTFSEQADGEAQYLRQQLMVNEIFWSDLYGWHCDGYDHGTGVLSVEWPLVSDRAAVRFRWSPDLKEQRRNLQNDKIILSVLEQLLNPGKCVLGRTAGIAILFLLRNVSSPLDFLARFESEIPAANRVELELWLSQLTPDPILWKCVEFDLTEYDWFTKLYLNEQPVLKAHVAYGEQQIQFDCISFNRSALTGKTLKATLLVPATGIDLFSIRLSDVRFGSRHCFHFSVGMSTAPPSFTVLSAIMKATYLPESYKRLPRLLDGAGTVPGSYRYSMKGVIGTNQIPLQESQFCGTRENAVLRSTTSEMLLKTDLLASRSAMLLGDTSDENPMLSVKELVLCLLSGGKRRSIVCVGNGAGIIPLVIVMEGIYQDELIGTPLMDLIVFLPTKPFSAKKFPRKLEQHHVEGEMIETCNLSWKTREHFSLMIRAVAGNFEHTCDAWGMEGTIRRCFFPTLFPTRKEKMTEVTLRVSVQSELGILRHGPDRAVDIMKALKEHGNSLLQARQFAESIFSYTLAALKIESVGVDDNDPHIRKLVAECHCNIAHVQTKIGSSDALASAVRSCGVAIHFVPTWGKPYYRRGLCREKQNLRELARKDFVIAKRLLPKDLTVSKALARVKHQLEKK